MGEMGVVLGVGGALLLGAISPGPSFLVTAQTSLAQSRRDGLLVALGLGVGGLLFALLALGGFVAVLMTVESVYVAVKVAGAAYLLWIAVTMWRGSRSPLVVRHETVGTGWRSSPFLRGLGVQVSNPKTAVVYASVFASLVPSVPRFSLYVALAATVFVVETGWYAIVAAGMSLGGFRTAYGRAKNWVDRIASVILAALGIRLLATATSRSL